MLVLFINLFQKRCGGISIDFVSVIDSEFLKFINNLHCRADNLKKDFEYIERELIKNNDLRNEGVD